MDDSGQLDLFDAQSDPRARTGRTDPADIEAKTMRAQIEAARDAKDLSKADLARLIEKNPAAIRRLLTSEDFNPELRTLIQVAGAVGLKLELVRQRRSYRKRNSGQRSAAS